LFHCHFELKSSMHLIILGPKLSDGKYFDAHLLLETVPISKGNCFSKWLTWSYSLYWLNIHAIWPRNVVLVFIHFEMQVAKELVKNGIEGDRIGIITPYNSQANLIRQAACITSLEIHTIDKYQGRDKDCILLSFVRSCENPTSCVASLLGDWHRINVALTRAKVVFLCSISFYFSLWPCLNDFFWTSTVFNSVSA
jgi:hypothetical protein